MRPLETHLLLTLPLAVAVIGGIWLWGRWEHHRDEGVRPEAGEEPFPGAWPFRDVPAGAEEPAKRTREKRTSVSP